ncbi:hypothetical protein EDD85DRAFT_795082 [Armillaria nabsnona]|nr:hypothetical protein EDD85DRAFT_795082 [Armillaria nabsnona]
MFHEGFHHVHPGEKGLPLTKRRLLDAFQYQNSSDFTTVHQDLESNAGTGGTQKGFATAGRVTSKDQRLPWNVGNAEHGMLRREFIIGSIAINQSRHRIEARDPAYGAHPLDCATRTHWVEKDMRKGPFGLDSVCHETVASSKAFWLENQHASQYTVRGCEEDNQMWSQNIGEQSVGRTRERILSRREWRQRNHQKEGEPGNGERREKLAPRHENRPTLFIGKGTPEQ